VTRETIIHIACLYGPICCAALLLFCLRPNKKSATGLLYATTWIAALLPWCDLAAVHWGFWSYQVNDFRIGKMPLTAYFGWVIAWGLLAPLLSEVCGKKPWLAIVALVILDLRTMPEMFPVLHLSQQWWVAEIAIALLLLVPAVFFAQWTASSENTPLRCAMLAPAFGGIFIGMPLLLLGGDLAGIHNRWDSFSLLSQIFFLCGLGVFSIPGLTALRDFALGGNGTPVPLEPPQKLVTHGIYSYLRNPMQVSMTFLLLLESIFLASPWPAVLAGIGIVYSEGFARWSETTDMKSRFGAEWEEYRRSHRSWIPTWRPRLPETSELWFDDHCGTCCEVADWFAKKSPRHLIFRKASEWPDTPLQRITWHNPSTGRTESGITAIAMVVQHLHLGWAAIGWFASLPGISHVIQICFDAAGAGKKTNV
jgi:protein-S-isoprenylcysteine O-methyltransferase Ste14/predicted DCC family thiol-disulfide oxidoreductase YuxK